MADTYTSARIEDLNPDTPSNSESIGTAAVAIRQIKKCLKSEASGGLQDKIDTAAKKAVMDRDYERGDIFITEKETNPSVLFGGTWQKLEAGQVIISKGNGYTPSVDYTPLFVVKTWKTDTTWGRVYSDGWCEQGGVSGYGKQEVKETINFNKPFNSTNYCVQLTCQYSKATGGVHNAYVNPDNKTTSGFELIFDGATSTKPYTVCWYACGYVNLNTDESTTKLSLLYLNTWKKVSD